MGVGGEKERKGLCGHPYVVHYGTFNGILYKDHSSNRS